MAFPASHQHEHLTPRADLALGLCVGNRYAGVVLATPSRLIRWGVHSFRHPTLRDRIDMLVAVVKKLLLGYRPGRVIVVATAAAHVGESVVAHVLAWLAEMAVRCGFTLDRRDATTIRKRIVPALEGRASNRMLAEVLRKRFPELRERRTRPIATTWRRLPPTSTERQRAYLYLAVAGCLARIDEHANPKLHP